MEDLNLKNDNGYLNIEMRKDGGIGMYVESPHVTLQLSKDEMLKVASWLVTYIESQK